MSKNTVSKTPMPFPLRLSPELRVELDMYAKAKKLSLNEIIAKQIETWWKTKTSPRAKAARDLAARLAAARKQVRPKKKSGKGASGRAPKNAARPK